MANENILREVDEELRSERMRAVWRRFGPWLIVAAVVVVLGVAINEGWSWWQQSQQARASEQFYAALELAESGESAAAQTALAEVVASGSGGYPALARFRQAALLAEGGQTAEAVAAYDAIANAESNRRLRELALTLAALLLVDEGDVAAVEQRVGSLAEPDNPMRHVAREALGLARYQAGDLEGARAAFEEAVADPEVPQETQQRLGVYLAQLIAEGAADPPAEAEPVVPAIDDAPHLDVVEPAAETEVPATAGGDAETVPAVPPPAE